MLKLKNMYNSGALVSTEFRTSDMCIVCFDNTACYTLVPCTHAILCETCVETCVENKQIIDKCPLCRDDFLFIVCMK